MKDVVLVLLVIFLGWIILRGQTKVMKRAWGRTLYHWEQTLRHFGEAATLFAVSILGCILVAIVIYAFVLDGL